MSDAERLAVKGPEFYLHSRFPSAFQIGLSYLPVYSWGRGVFDKSHIGQASSARRLVIEATYSL